MEVNEFIKSQICPLVVSSSLRSEKVYSIIDRNMILNSSGWESTEHGPRLNSLMSIDVGFGYDINVVSKEELYDKIVISLICAIPESFNSIEDEMPKSMTTLFENQIRAFILDSPMILTDAAGKIFDPRVAIQTHIWSFRIRLNYAIIPMVTKNGTLGFGVIGDHGK